MGHIGPFKNPRFTTSPLFNAANITSTHHPIKAYMKKYDNKFINYPPPLNEFKLGASWLFQLTTSLVYNT